MTEPKTAADLIREAIEDEKTERDEWKKFIDDSAAPSDKSYGIESAMMRNYAINRLANLIARVESLPPTIPVSQATAIKSAFKIEEGLSIHPVSEWRMGFRDNECLFCTDRAVYFVNYKTSAMRCCSGPSCITKAIDLALRDADNWVPPEPTIPVARVEAAIEDGVKYIGKTMAAVGVYEKRGVSADFARGRACGARIMIESLRALLTEAPDDKL
jgi:hypothetical protein